MDVKLYAELSHDGKRIEVRFPYSPRAIASIKGDRFEQGIPGRRFVGRDQGGPFWTVPLNLESGRELRRRFGSHLNIGPELRRWGLAEKRRQKQLRRLVNADDAELTNLPNLLPRVASIIEGEKQSRKDMPDWLSRKHPYFRRRPARTYQRADIAVMAQGSVLNANVPGTGKTIEYIGAQAEAGVKSLEGAHLILAPVTSHFDTWVTELLCCGVPGHILYGDTPAERMWAIREAKHMIEVGDPVWLILGYDDVRLQLSKDDKDERPVIARDHKGREYVLKKEELAPLYEVEFESLCIDESHKTGLPNPQTLFAQGVSKIKTKRRYSMSGTPMGGVALRLWGHLHFLEPKEYGSKWNWSGHWLVISENNFGKKEIGNILPGREEDFYRAHAHHMIRREKADALPGLPAKVQINVICQMTAKQKKQYRKFERDAEIRIKGQRVSARIVLAEYTRLKSFANAACEIEKNEKGKVRLIPTFESGKLPLLLEKLDENGIRREGFEPYARAIVGCEGVAFAEVTAQYLRRAKIEALVLHGGVHPKDRKRVLRRFRTGPKTPIVLCMTIDTGGVSLNLEEADSMHALDEEWDPDAMIQFEDRGDRGARQTALRCYTYRTKGTIQEYIQEVAGRKKVTNDNILDIHRQVIKVRTRYDD